MPTAHTQIEIGVPPAALMALLVDFARYPHFITDMEEAVVLREEPGAWTVRFAIHVIRRLEYTLQLVRTGDTRLAWSLVDGSFRANNGHWELEPLDEGRRTRAHYEVDLDLGMFVPGSVMKTLIERNLPATMECFRREAERQAP